MQGSVINALLTHWILTEALFNENVFHFTDAGNIVLYTDEETEAHQS